MLQLLLPVVISALIPPFPMTLKVKICHCTISVLFSMERLINLIGMLVGVVRYWNVGNYIKRRSPIYNSMLLSVHEICGSFTTFWTPSGGPGINPQHALWPLAPSIQIKKSSHGKTTLHYSSLAFHVDPHHVYNECSNLKKFFLLSW